MDPPLVADGTHTLVTTSMNGLTHIGSANRCVLILVSTGNEKSSRFIPNKNYH